MSPEIIGLIIGVVFIVPTIYLIRSKAWDALAWPAFLITLPVYYMLEDLEPCAHYRITVRAVTTGGLVSLEADYEEQAGYAGSFLTVAACVALQCNTQYTLQHPLQC